MWKKIAFHSILWIIAAGCIALAIIGKRLEAVVMALFCVYRASIRQKMLINNQYQMLLKHHQGSDWTRRILFFKDGIQVVDMEVVVYYEYENIVGIEEKGNYIQLIAKNDTIIRLYEDMFVDCSWNECKSYICEKINK